MGKYNRLKLDSAAEKAARQWIKEQGVEEYDLERLYDSMYKARQRAREQGEDPGKQLNLSWVNIKKAIQTTERETGGVVSAEEYIYRRKEQYQNLYRRSEVKQRIKENLFGVQEIDEETGEIYTDFNPEDVPEELLRKINRMSAADLANIYKKVMPDDLVSRAYKEARTGYDAGGVYSQDAWDEELRKAYERIAAENKELRQQVIDEIAKR